MASFYCHSCAHYVTASISETTFELECALCGGDAVELAGQGLEDFLAPGQETRADEPSAGSSQPQALRSMGEVSAGQSRSDLLHHIVGRVLVRLSLASLRGLTLFRAWTCRWGRR